MKRKVIDSHIHWRDPVHNVYEALSDKAPEENEERAESQATVYLPEDYFKDASDVEIVGFVHVEAEWSTLDPVGETRWLDQLERAGKTKGLPFGIIGFSDLSSQSVEAVLEGHSRSSLIRGIRQMLNFIEGNPSLCWAPKEYLKDPLWCKNFGLLSKYKLDFDLMCFGHQITDFVKLLKHHPKIPVHLEHAALPWDHSEEGKEVWRKGLKELAELEQVDLKISGLGNVIPAHRSDLIRSYVLEAIEIFGVDRVSFASNFPTDKQFSTMGAIWQSFEDIVSDFSEEEKSALFCLNAKKAYRL